MNRFVSFLALSFLLFTLSCSKEPNGGQNPGGPNPGPEPGPENIVPELPVDNSAEGIRHKILLTDFTGTGCPGCPGLLQSLDKVLQDESVSSKVVLTAAHQFNADDPAYFSDRRLYESFGITSFPSLVIGLSEMHDVAVTSQDNLLRWITDAAAVEPQAGVCASVVAKNGVVYVNTQIKALADNSFRVGVWLVEDGIKAVQAGTSDEKYYTHNACLRVADSKVGTRFYGHRLGDLKSGETAERLFTINLEDGWKQENCRVVVFVAAKGADDAYPVTNVLETKSLEEQVSYK